jgi:anti-sigma factor RsiW
MRWRRQRFVEHDLTCREAVRLVNRYLDDQLGPEDRDRLEIHLDECEHCGNHLEHLRITIGLAGQLREEDLDPLALEDMMNVYRRWRSDTHRPWSGRS